MTPKQYHFPYFFNLRSFNKELRSFGLSSYIKQDHNGMAETLVIIKYKLFQSWRSKDDLMEVPIGMTLMVYQKDLLFWKTGDSSIDMFKVSLENLEDGPEKLQETIELTIFNNCYGCTPTIELTDFVTYVRMGELKYETDFHETFALIIINTSY